MNWLGLDIGGANLKAADGMGWAQSVPYALWRDPEGLTGALSSIVASAPSVDSIAVTMTGELCDCFRTKAEGVKSILSSVETAAPGREIRVYLVGGNFATPAEAVTQPHRTAASNWHALATFAARFLDDETGILIDIGSTTTDLVPLVNRRPYSAALSDTERLVAGELVYTGVGRTPVCAVTQHLPWRDWSCPIAAELFATTADAYFLLGDQPQQAAGQSTADGRAMTKELAIERLARMVCADGSTYTDTDAFRAAEWIRSCQTVQITRALNSVVARMPARPSTAVVSGSGQFLAERIATTLAPCASVSLADELGESVSMAAAAHAVAILASEGQSEPRASLSL
jgi:probable H4MPT-linked C1 transfer pathway protein